MKRRLSLQMILLPALALLLLSGCSLSGLLQPRVGLRIAQQASGAPSPVPTATVASPAPASPASLTALEGTLERVYQQVNASVVNIQVLQKQTGGPSLDLPGLPFDFPLPQQPPQDQYQRGSGSGFVWDKQGHIVTNNHVIEGADKIRVTLADGTTVAGKVIGADPDSDLAVVQVDLPADRLQPVQLADSTRLKVGSLAIAIGQPFGLENSMTVGFVSALGRSMPVGSETGQGFQQPSYTIPDVIQTDAPINPGNSGGVLLNGEGQVIGVTSAIISPVRASAGIGFAVPSAIVRKVVPVLIAQGHYAHPWLGISGTTLDPDLAQAMQLGADQRGALVGEVTSGGPADRAGLRGSDRTITVDGDERQVGGDVIVAAGGEPIKTFDDVVSYLARTGEVGQPLTLTILRGGREQQVTVTVGERPGKQVQASPVVGRTSGQGRSPASAG